MIQNAHVVEGSEILQALRYHVSLSSLGFHYLPLGTIKKKIDPRDRGTVQLLSIPFDHQFAICIGTHLCRLPASSPLDWRMSWHTLFFPDSIWTSFTFPTMAQLLPELPKATFTV